MQKAAPIYLLNRMQNRKQLILATERGHLVCWAVVNAAPGSPAHGIARAAPNGPMLLTPVCNPQFITQVSFPHSFRLVWSRADTGLAPFMRARYMIHPVRTREW